MVSYLPLRNQGVNESIDITARPPAPARTIPARISEVGPSVHPSCSRDGHRNIKRETERTKRKKRKIKEKALLCVLMSTIGC
jgi:hypothetical protein